MIQPLNHAHRVFTVPRPFMGKKQIFGAIKNDVSVCFRNSTLKLARTCWRLFILFHPLCQKRYVQIQRCTFLVADTRLYTSPCRSVGPSVGPSVRFLNSERFSHYCSCPTVRDWIAVYPALFFLRFLLSGRKSMRLRKILMLKFNTYIYQHVIGVTLMAETAMTTPT